MAKSLERDPQLESILEGRKRDLGIGIELRPPARTGTRLQSRHRPRQRSGHRNLTPPIFHLLYATALRRLNRYCATTNPCPVLSWKPSETPAGGSAAMLAPDRIVRMKTILASTGLSRSTIYRKIAEGTFPASDQDQHQRRGLAGIRHRPLDRRSRRLAATNDDDCQNGHEPHHVVQRSSSSSSSWTSAARRFASAISSFADSPFAQASSISAQH